MSDGDGFFDDADDLANEVERQGGEPLIIQPDGSRKAYTRASSLGDFIVDTKFLQLWQQRYLVRQMGKNEDLAALAGLETYSTGFDEDSITKSASGKRLDAIAQRAFDRGRIHERADFGTVTHALTEPGNEGYEPVRFAADVQAFWEHVEENGIKISGTELFVVNDIVRTAGTFDHLVWSEKYGWTIADKKTGRNVDGLGFSVQFATYSRAKLYDVKTGERTDLTTLTGGEPINMDVALLFEVHDGMCRTRKVPISDDKGWRAAQLAAEVRDARKWNGMANIDKSFKTTKGDDIRTRGIIRRINEARFPEELLSIWYQWGANDNEAWSPEITEAAKAKKETEGWA
jgi:hypothetical protein